MRNLILQLLYKIGQIFRNISSLNIFAAVRNGEGYNFHSDGARTSDPSLGQRGPRTDPEQVYVLSPSLFFFFRLQVRVRLTYNRLSILAHCLARNWFSFPHIRGPSVTRGETRVGHFVQVPGHDSRPWSVYDFIPRSTVPRAWTFEVVLAGGGLYVKILEKGESKIHGRSKRLSDNSKFCQINIFIN